jgi:putative effector of murein hydrolase LrgA (UPF0299 family)
MVKLSQFLKEENGQYSATRLAFILWAIGVLIIFMYQGFRTTNLADLKIDGSIITILGILTTGKVSQKFFESKENTKSKENKVN